MYYGVPEFYEYHSMMNTVLQIPKTYTRTLKALYGDKLPHEG